LSLPDVCTIGVAGESEMRDQRGHAVSFDALRGAKRRQRAGPAVRPGEREVNLMSAEGAALPVELQPQEAEATLHFANLLLRCAFLAACRADTTV
jgi:hypothetical protein